MAFVKPRLAICKGKQAGTSRSLAIRRWPTARCPVCGAAQGRPGSRSASPVDGRIKCRSLIAAARHLIAPTVHQCPAGASRDLSACADVGEVEWSFEVAAGALGRRVEIRRVHA
jgi:hypothetical protein